MLFWSAARSRPPGWPIEWRDSVASPLRKTPLWALLLRTKPVPFSPIVDNPYYANIYTIAMSRESWFKIALPAFPVGFVIFGSWLYWGDNVIPLLPPALGFWGVTILYYLFTHLYIPERRLSFILTMGVAGLWLVTSITAHNLGRFVNSSQLWEIISVEKTCQRADVTVR